MQRGRESLLRFYPLYVHPAASLTYKKDMSHLDPTSSLPSLARTAPSLNPPNRSEAKSRSVRSCFHSPTNARNPPKASPEATIKALERQLTLARTQLSSLQTANQGLRAEVQESRVEVVQLHSVVHTLSQEMHQVTQSIATQRSSEVQSQLSVQHSVQSLRKRQKQYLSTGLAANSALKVWQWYTANRSKSEVSNRKQEEGKDGREVRKTLKVLVEKWRLMVARIQADFCRNRTTAAALTTQATRLCLHFNGIPLQQALLLAEKRFLHAERLTEHLSELQSNTDLLTTSLQHDQSAMQSHELAIKGETDLLQSRKKDLREQLEALKRQKAMKSIEKLRLERAFLAVLEGVKKLKLLEMLKEGGIACRMSEELRPEELETANSATIQRLFRVLDDKIAQILEKRKRIQTSIPSLQIPVSLPFPAISGLIVPPSIEEMLKKPFQWSNLPEGETYRSHRVLISGLSVQK